MACQNDAKVVALKLTAEIDRMIAREARTILVSGLFVAALLALLITLVVFSSEPARQTLHQLAVIAVLSAWIIVPAGILMKRLVGSDPRD
jgi:Kef-type K+ transport system membrane component KefB